MHWAEFEKATPELAELGRTLFARDDLLLLGTLRKDGSPRISPVEPDITNGKLYAGMIWRSLKALDLLRDPRCTLHSVVHDRMAAGGEFKLHARAVEINDLKERAIYGEALFERIGWKPDEPNYHLFAFDILSAGSFVTKGDYRLVTVWRAGEAVEKFRVDIDGNKEPVK